jgi:hypothetical protein
MEIVKRTIEQRLANRYMNRSPATLAWASKLNKLAGNPDIRQSPGRYAIGRLALSKKRRREPVIRARHDERARH